MMRSTTSGALFWLSLARASNRVTRMRMPTVPFAIAARAVSSSSVQGRPGSGMRLEVVDEVAEHAEVLVVGENLGRADRWAVTWFQVGTAGSASYQPGEM